jgi:hypothetical protein
MALLQAVTGGCLEVLGLQHQQPCLTLALAAKWVAAAEQTLIPHLLQKHLLELVA